MTSKVYIQTTDLTRKFKEKTALDRVNLQIHQGELFGLVGPDGAGKTTLLRTLAGLIGISDGTVRVADSDLLKNPESVKSQIGYMAQEFSLYSKLSVLENLQFFGELYDVPASIQRERVPGLLAFAQLTEFKDRRAAKLSGGMKKKLALACTLLHRPPILLLDEPTTGVDPISRREFWNILNDLHIQGTTIIVSTPYMDEAKLCDRIALIQNGKILEIDTPQNIVDRFDNNLYAVRSDNMFDLLKQLRYYPKTESCFSFGDKHHLLLKDNNSDLNELKAYLQNHSNLEIIKIEPGIEDCFMRLIGNKNLEVLPV